MDKWNYARATLVGTSCTLLSHCSTGGWQDLYPGVTPYRLHIRTAVWKCSGMHYSYYCLWGDLTACLIASTTALTCPIPLITNTLDVERLFLKRPSGGDPSDSELDDRIFFCLRFWSLKSSSLMGRIIFVVFQNFDPGDGKNYISIFLIENWSTQSWYVRSLYLRSMQPIRGNGRRPVLKISAITALKQPTQKTTMALRLHDVKPPCVHYSS